MTHNPIYEFMKRKKMTTMYYTVQIKLRTDEEQHEILQQYEYIYLSELTTSNQQKW